MIKGNILCSRSIYNTHCTGDFESAGFSTSKPRSQPKSICQATSAEPRSENVRDRRTKIRSGRKGHDWPLEDVDMPSGSLTHLSGQDKGLHTPRSDPQLSTPYLARPKRSGIAESFSKHYSSATSRTASSSDSGYGTATTSYAASVISSIKSRFLVSARTNTPSQSSHDMRPTISSFLRNNSLTGPGVRHRSVFTNPGIPLSPVPESAGSPRDGSCSPGMDCTTVPSGASTPNRATVLFAEENICPTTHTPNGTGTGDQIESQWIMCERAKTLAKLEGRYKTRTYAILESTYVPNDTTPSHEPTPQKPSQRPSLLSRTAVDKRTSSNEKAARGLKRSSRNTDMRSMFYSPSSTSRKRSQGKGKLAGSDESHGEDAPDPTKSFHKDASAERDSMIGSSRIDEDKRQVEIYSAIEDSELSTLKDSKTTCASPDSAKAVENLLHAIDAGDLAGTTSLLETNLIDLARGEFEWLSEVRDIGYSYSEIAGVLIEEKSQSPWICYTPPALVSVVQAGLHRSDCMHGWTTARDKLNTCKPPKEAVLRHDNMRLESETIRQIVAGMCGLGGVVPLTSEKSAWNGQVSFQAGNSIAEISYESSVSLVSLRMAEVLSRVQSAFDAFATVSGWLQEQELCCDSFTALVQTQADRIVETVSVPMGLVDRFRLELPALEGKSRIDEKTMHVADTSHEILNLFCPGELLKNFDKDKIGDFPDMLDILDCCALSAQAIGLALLTYSNAHVGHVRPFFLDGPITEVRLLGAGQTFSSLANLTLRPVTLTCMGDMLEDTVTVFDTWGTPAERECHLLASPEDILDTWGPGRLIFNQSRRKSAKLYELCAIEVGGGTIQRLQEDSNHLHWYRGHGETEGLIPIHPDAQGKTLVGVRPMRNENCPLNHAKSLKTRCSESLMHHLGTGPDEWRLTERQLGMQGGQYVTLSFTNTWVKREGATLKQTYCEAGSNTLWMPFLESFWAVQVSLCTGVAQRVRVHEMLSDVMLPFVNARFPEPQEWRSLLDDDKIIENFRSQDFKTWLQDLTPQKQIVVAEIVCYILRKLHTTGFDGHRNQFVVASVSPDDPSKCFRIQCGRDQVWAKVLKDSEKCATYAYVTTRCLETTDRKCRELEEAPWLRRSPAFLATAVCHCELPIDEDLRTSNYVLEAGVRYWMGRPGTRLVAELTKTSCSPDLRLNISLSRTREGLFRRFERLRQPEKKLKEKGLETNAEEVLLLTIN